MICWCAVKKLLSLTDTSFGSLSSFSTLHSIIFEMTGESAYHVQALLNFLWWSELSACVETLWLHTRLQSTNNALYFTFFSAFTWFPSWQNIVSFNLDAPMLGAPVSVAHVHVLCTYAADSRDNIQKLFRHKTVNTGNPVSFLKFKCPICWMRSQIHCRVWCWWPCLKWNLLSNFIVQSSCLIATVTVSLMYCREYSSGLKWDQNKSCCTFLTLPIASTCWLVLKWRLHVITGSEFHGRQRLPDVVVYVRRTCFIIRRWQRLLCLTSTSSTECDNLV